MKTDNFLLQLIRNMNVGDLEQASFRHEHLLSGLDEDMGIELLKAETELLAAAARYARLTDPWRDGPPPGMVDWRPKSNVILMDEIGDIINSGPWSDGSLPLEKFIV